MTPPIKMGRIWPLKDEVSESILFVVKGRRSVSQMSALSLWPYSDNKYHPDSTCNTCMHEAYVIHQIGSTFIYLTCSALVEVTILHGDGGAGCSGVTNSTNDCRTSHGNHPHYRGPNSGQAGPNPAQRTRALLG